MSACARVTSLPLMADCFDIDELPDEPAIAEDLRVALAGGAKNVREVLDKVPSTRRLVLIAIFRCLGAHKEVYRKGDSLPRVEHDYKTQLDAAKLLLSYQDGLPIQSVVTANATPQVPGSADPLLKAAHASPAMRAYLRSMLDSMETTALPA